jgi:hypothetical protein
MMHQFLLVTQDTFLKSKEKCYKLKFLQIRLNSKESTFHIYVVLINTSE